MSAVKRLALVPDVDAGDQGRDLTLLEEWEIYMRGEGRSNRTISEMIGLMHRLERFAGCRLEAVRPLDIARFLGRSRLNQNSRAAYYGYIHSFYRWWERNGGVNTAATVKRPKAPKGVPRPITDQQLRDLLAVRMHRRTRVMIQLAAYAGLRVHEIAKVRGEDVDPVARTLRVTGKGNKTAVLPLHPVLIEAAKGMPTRGWWFPGNSRRPGLPIRSRGVADVIGNAMARAGIPGGTAHRLRHWYGTKLVSSGTDLRTTQTLMRHEQLNTTARYVLVADPKLGEAINRLAPDRQPDATTEPGGVDRLDPFK